ncbi:MAG TPA: aminopeptidase P family protein [Alphaproteobacteria bacterium]|nr:aminopeptidase P family protein [Alphaproteobacteria bacterium]
MAVRKTNVEAGFAMADLARLLRSSRSRYDVAEVRRLIAGVLAAPTPLVEPDRWVELVAPRANAALVAALLALKKIMAEQAAGDGDETVDAQGHGARLGSFRTEIARRGLAGFILPRGDAHQGEYVAARDERLAWLTGFTGSAGLAIILARRAAIFVDGRYTLQARAQVNANAFEIRHLIDDPAQEWLAGGIRRGERIGFDPWLHTQDGIARFETALARVGGKLVAVERNPVDAIWPNQPPPPLAPVVPHDIAFAGKRAGEKRVEIAKQLAKDGFAAAVISAPESIAWLLNIRGGDVPHTPLALSFAIVHVESGGGDALIDLFIDARKLIGETRGHLGNRVRIMPPEALGPALDRLGRGRRKVLIDAVSGASWIVRRLMRRGAQVARGSDPCMLPKACKNVRELANTRAAHVRDGAAVTRFLAWLTREAPHGRLTEIDAAERLLAFRRDGRHFRDLSFTTISGAGPNGAIVHYRATPETNRRISPDMLYLVDSGAQYLDGTTDVTRTVAIGRCDSQARDRFTRVLKGHIAIATTRFPRGTTGSQLDVLARRALWDVGLDFDHGTGHGVGSYLSVHEGPQRISKAANAQALLPGMIVSNEPGYYKTGAFGIRIENLVAVGEVPKDEGMERQLLGFETLTLAPIDRTLIEPSLLSADELAWLNDYHARVRATLAPLIDADTAQWLEAATAPVG